MKPYSKWKNERFAYPEDMQKIIAYLRAHGDLNVSGSTVEDLYYRFSDEVYCASWMSVDDKLLEEFADWLDEIKL